MKTGIAQSARAAFAALLPQFVNGTLTGTQFRKTVMNQLIDAHACSIGSAATNYNAALKLQRKNDPASVATLGRVLVAVAPVVVIDAAPAAADETAPTMEAVAETVAETEAVVEADETAPAVEAVDETEVFEVSEAVAEEFDHIDEVAA